jgi:hypothetical protein
MSQPILDQQSDVIVSKRVINVLALPPGSNQSLGPQELEPLGNRRKVIRQLLGQLRDAHLAFGKQSQQLQTAGIPQRAKDRCGSFTSLLVDQRQGPQGMRMRLCPAAPLLMLIEPWLFIHRTPAHKKTKPKPTTINHLTD